MYMGNAGPSASIGEIATQLNLNKTTVYRLLIAMAKFGLIERTPEGESYQLGLKLHELGTKAIESRSLRGEAHPFLLELARKTGESVHLAVAGPRGAVCLDDVPSGTNFMVRTPIGCTFEVHCSAIGKAVAAFLPETELDSLVHAHQWTKYTVHTRTKPEDIRKDLEDVVTRGYAIDREETEIGISCIAVPLHLPPGRGHAAVGMSGLTNRFRSKALAEKIALNKETVALIAQRLRP
jgi:DNA-binding IclR family transcriptional regulator